MSYRNIKSGIYLALILSLIACAAFYVEFFHSPHRLSRKDAVYTTRNLTGYWVDNDAVLIHGLKHREDFSDMKNPEPATVCTVFSLSASAFADSMSSEFIQVGTVTEKGKLPLEKGCSRFKNKTSATDLSLFKSVYWDRDGSPDYTVYVNKADRIVMFKMYFYNL